MKRSFFVFLLGFILTFAGAQPLHHDSLSGLNYVIQEGKKDKPIIIMIHGYGTNEKDLFFMASLFPECTFVCPQGWLNYGPNAYSWYDIEFKDSGEKIRNIDQSKASITKILRFIETFKNPKQKIIVGGFSQGAILSVQIALEHPDKIDGVIGLSGMLIDPLLAANDAYQKAYANLKVFYAHGTKDQILSVTEGRKCKEQLQSAGVQLEYREYDTAHRLTNEELQDLSSWLKLNFINS